MENEEQKIEPAANNGQDDEAIAEAIRQMDTLYKSRCVKAPLGTNVVIREIPSDNG